MMGSACSLHRSSRSLELSDNEDRHHHRLRLSKMARLRRSTGTHTSQGVEPVHSSLRYTVTTPIHDDNIAALFPISDSFVAEADGTLTPKSLAELAIDAICRSLIHRHDPLPEGLPPDVLSDIVGALQRKNAWNPSTLAAFRNCELEVLNISKCRGVNDAWIAALTTGTASDSMIRRDGEERYCMDAASSCHCDHHSSSTSYASAASSPPFDEDMDCVPTLSLPHGATLVEYPENMILTHCNEEFHEAIEEPLDNIDKEVDAINDLESLSSKQWGTWRSPPVTAMMTELDLSGSLQLTDRGLLQFNSPRRLEIARFDHCHQLVGHGLAILASSHHLHTLSLGHCRRLIDDGLVYISHLRTLESLCLTGCRCLTDRSLATIATLYSLRHLDLTGCDLISDAGLEQLQSLEALREVSLGWCRKVTDQGLDCFSRQPGRSTNLCRLRIARCGITDATILSRLTNLQELDVNGCKSLRSAALGDALRELPNLQILDVSRCPGIFKAGWQGKIDNLKTLNLSFSNVKDNHLSKLSKLPSLEELNLDSCLIGDWAMAHLADNDVVPNLTCLDLSDTQLSDAGMVHIAKLKNLRRLTLFYCNITNRGLSFVAQLSQLEVLNIDSRDISDDGLRPLKDLKSLRSLDIFSGRITNYGCTFISSIPSLECLDLCAGGIGDAGCQSLARLVNLQCLNLSQNEGISNQGAAVLAKSLTRLKDLNLSYTGVSSDVLHHLSSLTELETLSLYGCRVMKEHIRSESLQILLPSLRCFRVSNSPEGEGAVLVDSSTHSFHDDDLWIGNPPVSEPMVP